MKIALIGDIALFGCNKANCNYKKKFDTMQKYLSQFDYVIGNLETPLTSVNKPIGGKSAYIKGDLVDAEILDYLKITHVTLANNHTFDFREEGLKDTINVLNLHGIKWYGAYGKATEIVNDSCKVRLHGYCCYSTNGKGLARHVNVLDPVNVENEIATDKLDGYLSILSMHWGQEHVHFPNYDHVLLARKLATKGDIIIHGHHPHVIQGIEREGKSIIAYSLGNFCFDDIYTNKSKQALIELSSDNKEAMILGLEIENNQIINIEATIFSFENEKYVLAEKGNRSEEWSLFLKTEEKEYRSRREVLLTEYLNKRKAKRDFNWYWKRMNLESVKMIWSSRKNHKMYEELIQRYIEE